MRRLLLALPVLLACAMPAAAQQPAVQPYQRVMILEPFHEVVPERYWPAIEDAIRKGDGMWERLFPKQGWRLTRDMLLAGFADIIAGGETELIVAFTGGCGSSGCWTYILELKEGRVELITQSVLPEALVVWRNAGQTHSVIQGYRHGLFHNGRSWVQFCTDERYCG
jgi:hypothetical protein